MSRDSIALFWIVSIVVFMVFGFEAAFMDMIEIVIKLTGETK